MSMKKALFLKHYLTRSIDVYFEARSMFDRKLNRVFDTKLLRGFDEVFGRVIKRMFCRRICLHFDNSSSRPQSYQPYEAKVTGCLLGNWYIIL